MDSLTLFPRPISGISVYCEHCIIIAFDINQACSTGLLVWFLHPFLLSSFIFSGRYYGMCVTLCGQALDLCANYYLEVYWINSYNPLVAILIPCE